MAADAVVLDASVIVAAVSPTESRHRESLEFLEILHLTKRRVEVPAHFLLELYGVLSRSPREVQRLGFMTPDEPVAVTLRTIGEADVEAAIAWASAALPGASPTRGADLAYAWLAHASGLPLVTLDKGLHQFAGHGVRVHYPRELLALWAMDR